MQTAQTQFRRRKKWRLIRVSTVCLQFAYRKFYSNYNKGENSTETPKITNGLIQLIRMDKFIGQKRVNIPRLQVPFYAVRSRTYSIIRTNCHIRYNMYQTTVYVPLLRSRLHNSKLHRVHNDHLNEVYFRDIPFAFLMNRALLQCLLLLKEKIAPVGDSDPSL